MYNNINLELYRVFYFIVQAGSISNAANELFITQPAVSQSLKHLENKLGCQLFIRNKKNILLTSDGQTLYNYIEKAYNFIIAAEKRIFEAQNLSGGDLRIGAGDSICYHYLAKYLETFHTHYPGVKIQVTNRTSDETINLLKSGSVDIGLVSSSSGFDSSISYTPILKIIDCFVAGIKYKELSKTKISLTQLSEYPLLLLEKVSQSRRFIDKFFIEKGIVLNPEIELGSLDLLVSFAKIGLGISCVIKNYFLKELNAGEVFEIPLKEKIPPRYIYLAQLKKVPVTKITETFVNILHEKN